MRCVFFLPARNKSGELFSPAETRATAATVAAGALVQYTFILFSFLRKRALYNDVLAYVFFVVTHLSSLEHPLTSPEGTKRPPATRVTRS